MRRQRTANLSPEAYAGFIWWPYNVPPALSRISMACRDRGRLCHGHDVRPAVEQSSRYRGRGLRGGRVDTLSEKINYMVYCLLMTPDGASATRQAFRSFHRHDTTRRSSYTNSPICNRRIPKLDDQRTGHAIMYVSPQRQLVVQCRLLKWRSQGLHFFLYNSGSSAPLVRLTRLAA